jgi:hypothetical protein
LADLARVDEARSATQAVLARDPSFTIRRFRASAASDNPTYLTQRERIYEGMRKGRVARGVTRVLNRASATRLAPTATAKRAANAAASVERRTIRHLNTEFAGFLHKVALFGPLSELMLRESNRGDET